MNRPQRGREYMVRYAGDPAVIDPETGVEIELKPGDDIEFTHMCASKKEMDRILGELGFRRAYPPAAGVREPDPWGRNLLIFGSDDRLKVSELPRGIRFRFTQLAEQPRWQFLSTPTSARRHVWFRYEDDRNVCEFLHVDHDDQRGIHRRVGGSWSFMPIDEVPDDQLPWDVFHRLRLLRL
ncbi:MAG: hypothetical protein HYV13_01115 [Candidatus Doudnabacteria bacterium]|nr:hypothetical protein [Candidatus Doudnabacteria bacterium]